MKKQKFNLTVLLMVLMGLSLVLLPRVAGAEDQTKAGGAGVQGTSDIKEDKQDIKKDRQDIKADKKKLHHEKKKQRRELRKDRKELRKDKRDLRKDRRDLRRDKRKKHHGDKDDDKTQSETKTQAPAQP